MLIKKYGNRRLYDTAASRYITLDELGETVRAGADVQVVDAKTNEDLTQQTLTQIILENRRAARLLPVPLLVQLIRLGDDALGEFFNRYVIWALEVYLQTRQGAMGLASLNPFAAAIGNPLSRMMGGLGWGEKSGPPPQRPVPPPPPAPASAEAAVVDARSELADLRQKLESLQRSMGGAPKSPARRKRK